MFCVTSAFSFLICKITSIWLARLWGTSRLVCFFSSSLSFRTSMFKPPTSCMGSVFFTPPPPYTTASSCKTSGSFTTSAFSYLICLFTSNKSSMWKGTSMFIWFFASPCASIESLILIPPLSCVLSLFLEPFSSYNTFSSCKAPIPSTILAYHEQLPKPSSSPSLLVHSS